jgi:UPF0716 protein FxsA
MRISAIILLLLPLAEIAGFVVVGQWLGVLTTLALIVTSTMLGVIVLRNNGITLSRKLRRAEMEEKPGRVVRALFDGTAPMFGGFLLVLPGFITDIVGILLLIPLVRSFLWAFIKTRFVVNANVQWGNGPSSSAKSDTVVDLDINEYQRQEPKSPSPWKQLPKDEG